MHRLTFAPACMTVFALAACSSTTPASPPVEPKIDQSHVLSVGDKAVLAVPDFVEWIPEISDPAVASFVDCPSDDNSIGYVTWLKEPLFCIEAFAPGRTTVTWTSDATSDVHSSVIEVNE